MKIRIVYFVLILSTCQVAFGQRPADKFLRGEHHSDQGSVKFRLFVPEDSLISRPVPLIMTLHGSGERGSDNNNQILNHRIAETWAEDFAQKQHPAFVLSPQVAQGIELANYLLPTYWPIVEEILDSLIVEYPIDTSRLYVTGLSLGSIMAWYYIYVHNRDRFAAAIPMSGGWLQPESQVTNIPIWAFHGDIDTVVPVQDTRDMASEIENAGFEVEYINSQLGDIGLTLEEVDSLMQIGVNHLYTEYAVAGHIIWSQTYDDPLLHRWLFAQDKSERLGHDLRVETLPISLFNTPVFARNVTPEVEVRNFGLNEESGVSISCEIDSSGILVYSDTKTIDAIKPLEFMTVTFDDWHTYEKKNYDITIYTQLSTDEDKSTDTLRSVINVSILVDDFESGFDKWVSDSGWGTDVTAFKGRFSMDSSPGGRYANNMNASVTYKYGFDLSNIDNAHLSFWSLRLMVPGDSGFVEISTDGGTNWEGLGEGQTGTHSFWEQRTHSLQDYSGADDVRFRFRFVSDDNRTAIGWFIDDIKIFSTPTNVADIQSGAAVSEFELLSNYPNPFNPSTQITYHLRTKNHVELAIFDMLGKKIRTLVDKQHQAGTYEVNWNGRNDEDNPVSSGLYLYKLQAGEFSQVKKMMLLR